MSNTHIVRNKRKSLFEHLVGSITERLDKYLIRVEEAKDVYFTYLMHHEMKLKDDKIESITYCIRVPGSTVGYLVIDTESRITEIKLYDEIALNYRYNHEVVDELNDMIGDYLIVEV